jgi:hypothetical protein
VVLEQPGEHVLAHPAERRTGGGQAARAVDVPHPAAGGRRRALRVQVYPKAGGEPAVEVAFTEISFDRPDPEQFAFTPPPGAKEQQLPAFTHAPVPFAGAKTIGSGWTTVLVAPVPEASAEQPGGPEQMAGLAQLLPRVSGSWGGGHLLSGKLFSVLVTDDGRVLAGLVSPERLYQVAADPAAKVK